MPISVRSLAEGGVGTVRTMARMQRNLLWLFPIVAVATLAARSVAQDIYLEEAAVDRFVNARLLAARQGHADLVRIPIAFHGEWGCDCPTNPYVGTSEVDAASSNAWLDLEDQSPEHLPTFGNRGGIVYAEGFYDGNVREERHEGSNFRIQRFVVTRVVRRGEGQMRVVRRSAASCESRVEDESPLNVRAAAGARSPVRGTLTNGTAVTVDRVRNLWVHLSAPTEGWAYSENVRSTCTLSATTP